MLVLGLDPSLTGYGWCLLDTEKAGHEMLVDYGVWKTTTKTYMPYRYRYLEACLREVVEKYPSIDWVGIEHPPYQASYALGLYALFMDTWEVLADHRLPYVCFLPTQLKAYVRDILGDKGKMFKSDMKDAAKQVLGGSFPKTRFSHNVADALLVAYEAGRFRDLLLGNLTEEDLTKREQASWTKTVKRRKTGKIDEVGLIFNEGENSWEDLTLDKYDKFFNDHTKE